MDSIRYKELDVVRVLASWLRCVLHTLVPFMVYTSGMWRIHYHNGTNLLPDLSVLTIHSFIMEAFFIIAGIICVLELSRKGLRGYIKNRLRKIVLPFTIGILVLVPFIIFLFGLGSDLMSDSFHWQFRDWFYEAWINWSSRLVLLGHLWFLYYLLFYYLIVLGIIHFAPELIEKLKKIRITRWITVVPLLLLCFYYSPVWYIINPLTSKIEWPSFLYYLIWFIFGVYFSSHLQTFKWLAGKWIWTIATFMTISLLNASLQPYFLYPHPTYQVYIRYLVIVLSATQTISGLIMIYSLALKWRYMANTPWFKRQVQSAYWIYLAHAPIVMVMHLMMFSLGWPLVIKFIVILPLSVFLASQSYWKFGRWLLGK